MSFSHPFPPVPPPPQQPPSFTRRMATKVISLIAKFEALSTTTPFSTASYPLPSHPQPLAHRRTSIHFFRDASPSPQDAFSALARRPSWATTGRLETTPERIDPPKKRILRRASKRWRRGRKRTVKTEEPWKPEGGSGVDGNYSPLDERKPGTTGGDGTDEDEGGSGKGDTPPVARVLPSSFFSQLVVSDDEDTVSFSGEEEEQEKIRISKHAFRLYSPKQSAWRRKITPPKISVKDLISKFRVSPVDVPSPLSPSSPRSRQPRLRYIPPFPPPSTSSSPLLQPPQSPETASIYASAPTTQREPIPRPSNRALNIFRRPDTPTATSPLVGNGYPVPFASPPPRVLEDSDGSDSTYAGAVFRPGEEGGNDSGTEGSGRRFRKTPPPRLFFRRLREATRRAMGGTPSLYTLSSEDEEMDNEHKEEDENAEENSEALLPANCIQQYGETEEEAEEEEGEGSGGVVHIPTDKKSEESVTVIVSEMGGYDSWSGSGSGELEVVPVVRLGIPARVIEQPVPWRVAETRGIVKLCETYSYL